ncbi:hypothetical protein BLNAU_9716 [Blattamonas nauphoetae]|uniref:Right handed beta helix domain-containing protein n=1 Tax=Blattamonas nauphoetae TaxID=2049346 RepID=A0ABQ9XV43_9EUKA|nr:hypothetical protein BLNAU_9716 [Blattamonas nauphoetae]
MPRTVRPCGLVERHFDNCSTGADPWGLGGTIHLSGDLQEGHAHGKQLSVVDCILTDCTAIDRGAGVYHHSHFDLSIVSTTFERCACFRDSAVSVGGAIYCDVAEQETLTVEGTQFIECTSEHAGGAIFCRAPQFINISDTVFKNCHSGTTGAICIIPCSDDVRLTLLRVFFVGNSIGGDTTFFMMSLGYDDNTTKFPDIAIIRTDYGVSPKLTFDDSFTTTIPDPSGMFLRTYDPESGERSTGRSFDAEFNKIGPLLTAIPTASVNEETGKIELEIHGKTPPISQEYEVTVTEDAVGTTTTFRMLFSDGTGTLVSPSGRF